MLTRRGFLGACLAAGVAPAIIRLPGVLMLIKPRLLVATPEFYYRWFIAGNVPDALDAGWQYVEEFKEVPPESCFATLLKIK